MTLEPLMDSLSFGNSVEGTPIDHRSMVKYLASKPIETSGHLIVHFRIDKKKEKEIFESVVEFLKYDHRNVCLKQLYTKKVGIGCEILNKCKLTEIRSTRND